jgi:thiol-disulfide isomerase/thioredoxin
MKVLKFGATWCPGCLIMRPRWQEIEKELPWLHTVYFDFDTDIEAVEKWNISDVLPVFIFVDYNNREITRLTGEPSKEKLMKLIEEHKDK